MRAPRLEKGNPITGEYTVYTDLGIPLAYAVAYKAGLAFTYVFPAILRPGRLRSCTGGFMVDIDINRIAKVANDTVIVYTHTVTSHVLPDMFLRHGAFNTTVDATLSSTYGDIMYTVATGKYTIASYHQNAKGGAIHFVEDDRTPILVGIIVGKIPDTMPIELNVYLVG